MPWNPTEKFMTGDAVSIGDISQAVGYESEDLGTLIVNGIINMFSRYKPMNIASFQPTDTQRGGPMVRWGVIAKATNLRNALFSMNLDWMYERSQPPHYNDLDFKHYYGKAPVPFMQANGLELVVDVVAGNQDPVLFYMLMSAGALANKAFSNVSGIDTHANAVPSNRIDYCLPIEDISFYDADGGAWHTLLGAQLGLVIFSTSGQYKGDIWATHDGAACPVAELQAVESDMYIVSTADLMDTPGLGLGDFIAVACGKKVEDGHTYYLCAYNGNAAYPARFPLKIGGLERYPARAVGLGSNSTPSTVVSVLTTGSRIYVTVRLTNNSGRILHIVRNDSDKFTLHVLKSGKVVDARGKHEFNNIPMTVASFETPAIDTDVPAGGNVDLVYRLDNIWNYDDGTIGPQILESGYININAKLIFKNIPDAYFPSQGISLLTVTYGSV